MAFDFRSAFSNELTKEYEGSISRLSGSRSAADALVDTNPFKDDPITSSFGKTNTSYSGTDCTVVVQINETLIVLGNLQTFSFSIFREKAPVRVLGKSHAKGYTAGGRTISGSMVFIVFDRAPLFDIIKHINYIRNPSDRYTTPLPDQLPPLDLILIYHNEYGHSSILRLYGVEFIQEGQVQSVNDIYTENTTQYVARDIDTLIAFDKLEEFKNMMFERQVQGKFIDSHLASMLEYKRMLENQISKANTEIQQIDNELARRTAAGVFTLGIAPLAYEKFSGTETRGDLLNRKAKDIKLKEAYLKELDAVNNQIYLHEKNIIGWNAQNGTTGVAQADYASHAPAR